MRPHGISRHLTKHHRTLLLTLYKPCAAPGLQTRDRQSRERELWIDNLLVRIHYIIEMIRWTGLAPWEFEFRFPSSLISTFLVLEVKWLSHELLVSLGIGVGFITCLR